MLEKRACMQSIDCHLVFRAERWQGWVLIAKMSVDSVKGARVWKSFAISHLE
jgi:hypothetical protein